MEQPGVTLVGTGMKGTGLVQSTRLAITQLVASSKTRLTILAPYFDQDGADFLAPCLQAALDRRVSVLLMVRTGVRASDLNVPGLRRLARTIGPEILERSVELIQLVEREDQGEEYGLHAKVVIADGLAAYIGSSNLTRNGLDRNFEVGLIVAGQIATDLLRTVEPLAKLPGARHLSWRSLAA